MGKQYPILSGVMEVWEDGVVQYGNAGEQEGDTVVYVLAHQETEHRIRREEDGDEMKVDGDEYELYPPDELSVDQYRAMKKNGWHFHDITESDLVKMLDSGFDGRSCN